MHTRIPNAFYRISIKALVLDTERRFLLCQEADGTWELPGGGLDWGENPQEGLQREIREELGIETISVAEQPSYFVTAYFERKDEWKANVLYEVTLAHLNFKPSDECVAINFFASKQIVNKEIEVIPTVYEFAKVYNTQNHE